MRSPMLFVTASVVCIVISPLRAEETTTESGSLGPVYMEQEVYYSNSKNVYDEAVNQRIEAVGSGDWSEAKSPEEEPFKRVETEAGLRWGVGVGDAELGTSSDGYKFTREETASEEAYRKLEDEGMFDGHQ